MARNRMPTKRGSRPLDRLFETVRDAEDWPLAGSAVRRLAEAESWALIELKQRLDALDAADHPDHAVAEASPPSAMLADLIRRSYRVDPDAARDALYRQTLEQLVPDQISMLAVLAEREVAPACNVGGSRFPAGPLSVTVLTDATSLGRDAGVLLRDCVPHYVGQMRRLGLLDVYPEEDTLDAEYDLLLADTQLREAYDHVRHDLGLYPRIVRQSLRMSDYARALWRDCRGNAETEAARARRAR